MTARERQRAETKDRARFVAAMFAAGWRPRDVLGATGYTHQGIRQLLRAIGLKPEWKRKTPKPRSKAEKYAQWREKWTARIESCKSDGCWKWDGATYAPNRKYPHSRYSTISTRCDEIKFDSAHRLSYFLFKGEIPDGMTVDHICYNPLCVNPDHLRVCTLSENAANKSPEWYAKHRARRKVAA
jgi:hypothetical protein